MVSGLPLTLVTYVFVVVTGCTFQFMGPLFSLLFSKLSKLSVWLVLG